MWEEISQYFEKISLYFENIYSTNSALSTET